MNTHIDTLMKMKVGQIKELEEEQKRHTSKFYDIIDRQKETIASYLEQNKVDENWAEKFLKEMEIEKL